MTNNNIKTETIQTNRLTSYLPLQHQVLSLPILQHLQRLQGAHNVHWIDSSFLTDLCASQILQQSVCFVHARVYFSPRICFQVLINFPHQQVGSLLDFALLSLTFDRDLLALEIVHVSE